MTNPLYKDIGTPEIRVIEECSELIQEISKAQRFGYFSYHPDQPGKTNLERVKAEMDDVVEAIERLQVHMRFISHNHFSNEGNQNEQAQ